MINAKGYAISNMKNVETLLIKDRHLNLFYKIVDLEKFRALASFLQSKAKAQTIHYSLRFLQKIYFFLYTITAQENVKKWSVVV